MRYAKIAGNLLGLLALLLFTITTCKSQEGELPFETVAKSNGFGSLGLTNYGEENPTLSVIADKEIDTFTQDVLNEDPELVDQLRQLDYDRFFAILVLQGLKHQGGYSVTVQQVRRQGNQVNVQAEFISPSPGTRRIQAFTSPYHLIAVSKEGTWEQQIRFVLMVNGEPVAETTHFIPQVDSLDKTKGRANNQWL